MTDDVGSVTSVTGSKAGVSLPPRRRADGQSATVGKFVGVEAGRSLIVGVITAVRAGESEDRDACGEIDLMGNIRYDEDGERRFHRGVSDYPAIGDRIVLMDSSHLRLIYHSSGRGSIEIGTLHQDPTIPARIDVDDLLNKHFAVLGTTGVGKSSGTAVILDEILKARLDLRIFLLDGHNEYGRCFGDRAHVVNSRNLKLPFWLFNFEEIVDVIYGGRPGIEEELEVLSEVIPIAKGMYSQYKMPTGAIRRKGDTRASGYTIDTPVPYTLQDLLSLIDERMGKLENRAARMHFHRLMTRIEAIRSDPRYTFMFENANVGGDTMGDLLSQLFRLDPSGKPVTVMQLAGLPAEVVDAVVCVLCRLAFDFGLWSDGAVPLLVVCEEAHRYASVDHTTGFHPTRRALARIAREGRKYGVFLGLVTQRPAELDPTIIAQCGTLFAMRMANDRDQALLRSAVSDAAANLLAFVPSLETREMVAFGEGVPVPARMTFRDVPADRLPRSETSRDLGGLSAIPGGADFVRGVIERWRGAHMSFRSRSDEGEPDGLTQKFSSAPAGESETDQIRARLLRVRLDSAGTRPTVPQAT